MSVEVDDVWLYEMILDYLKKTEAKYPTLVRESPHFLNGDRKLIVEWISKLTKIFKIGVEAHHLAIFLFDFFIADHQADSQGLYLIGAASFSVACKVNDIEVNIPQASKILKLAPFENVMQSYLLKSTEILLLQHFNWNVHKPTEASFLEYYAASCLAIELEGITDQDYGDKIAKYFHKWVAYFREKVLLNDEFRDYLPSKVACAIVISTRISMSLAPQWPDFMVHLTGWCMSDLIQIVNNLRNGLRYDLIMEKNQAFQFYDPCDIDHEICKLNEFPSCSNRGDVETNISFARTKDTYLKFVSSLEPYINGTSIPTDVTNHGNIANYFTTTTPFYDSSDTSLQNSKVMLNSHYISMGDINKQNMYLQNGINTNERLIAPAPNDYHQLYFSNNESHDNSIESLSNACDTSFNISNDQYSSSNSYVTQPTNEESIINYYKPPVTQSVVDDQEQNCELPLNYLTPISDSISSSSSSLYLIVSQSDDSRNKQQHSKHSHSIVVNPNNIPPRRSQNRDSIISNSMNNGYYALKKRAPGLVINVNGAGSSYSFNCVNNVNSTRP